MPASDAITALARYAKADSTYVPVADKRTTRWHVDFNGRDYELLATGTKFWDTRAGVGGGGAVDLAMHLLNSNFRSAVAHLKEHGL